MGEAFFVELDGELSKLKSWPDWATDSNSTFQKELHQDFYAISAKDNFADVWQTFSFLRMRGSETLSLALPISSMLREAPLNESIINWMKVQNRLQELPSSDVLNLDTIIELHAMLVSSSASHGLRTESARLSGHSIPAIDSSKLLDHFLKKSMPPIAKAIAVSILFSSVHPFKDGNGRMSRLISDFILADEGLPPFLFDAPSEAFCAVYEAEKIDWQKTIMTRANRFQIALTNSIAVLKKLSGA